MELTKIWERFNISFILILPLFKGIIDNIKSKDNHNISIHSLFYEYGLINCYLLDKNLHYDGTIKLVFDKKKVLICDLLDKIDKPLASLLDVLISNKYFVTIRDVDDYIIIYLKVDKIWDKDIKYIIKSKYSKVSEDFKDFITYKGSYSLSSNTIINYLYLKNVPAKIVIKHKSLQEAILDIFKMPKDSDLPEVFPEFSKERESLDINNLKTIKYDSSKD